MTNIEQNLESPREVALRVGWPLARVRKLIRDREIRHLKIGGLYFVPQGAVEEYLAARIVEPDFANKQVTR